jgi:hypothetical protein
MARSVMAKLEPALKAARDAGFDVAKIEIENGKIVLIRGDGARQVLEEPVTPLDAWRASRGKG